MMNAMQDDFQMNPEAADNWDAFEQRNNWQLVPPVVTSGRLTAVQPGQAPQAFQSGSAMTQGSPDQDQDSTSLFNVNFMGADQNWYSVSARVKRPPQRLQARPNLRVARPEEVSPDELQSRRSIAQPAPHPTWSGADVDQDGRYRPQSSTAFAAPASSMINPAWQYPSAEAAGSGYADAKILDHPLNQTRKPIEEKKEEEETDQSFLLQIIQPGLVGLMDGSVSTLAPIFAVAFATHQPFTAFLVGMASALGAGISMAFAEGLSDDGDLTGRGSPLIRGAVTGFMTFLSGAGHALPFLIPNLTLALYMAYAVVAVELFFIAAIRYKYFKTKLWLSLVQVVGGGLLVFLVALLLGNA